ncbi:MAG TPA: EF-P lysine aminoacylase EpmA [Myxococcales bacterium]|nr:EF-P lysine aminoacylase EpmA [Myxococcales bacterium]
MPATAAAARARAALYSSLRASLEARGSMEVETPIAVPFAGQEPHLRPFETRFTPDLPIPPGGIGEAQRLHLHTSPEYAMKRLLAREGFGKCHQIARVFRDGEVTRTHNPEFTLLEFYSSPGSADSVMRDLEGICEEAAQKLNGATEVQRLKKRLSLRAPYERLTCQEAFERFAGFDPLPLDAQALSQAARTVGVRPAPDASWDDLFTQLLMEKVEPCLGIERPTYLTHYPASQAALARLSPEDPRVAERFELYAGGLELANGFSELCDADEQRKRLTEEQELRRSLGREVFPLDEKFLEALPKIHEAGGVAVGLDRLLMLLIGAQTIAEVLLFPAAEEYGAARS